MKTLNHLFVLILFLSLFSCVDVKEEITQDSAVLPFLEKEKLSSAELPQKIVNREQLESVLNFHYKDIFSKIPVKELAAFIETVEYNERGITTFRYDYLKNNVSKEELQTIYEILLVATKKDRRSMKVEEDWYQYECPFEGYRCYQSGSCLKANRSWICTCNC